MECKKNITKLIENTSVMFMVLMFSLSNLTVLNFFFMFTGISSKPTTISLIIYLIMDAILLTYAVTVLIKKKLYAMFVILLIINCVYIFPILATRSVSDISKYIIFVAPYSLVAVLLVSSGHIRSKVFSCIDKFIPVVAILAVIYVSALITFKGGDTFLDIRALSYGNIAWFFLTFHFLTAIKFVAGGYRNGRQSVLIMIYLSLLSLTVFYTGLRTGTISMFFAVVLTILLVLLHGDSKKVIFKRFIVLTAVSVAVVAVGHKFMPPGSRAMFIEAITEYELKGHDAGEIKAPKKVDIRHLKFPKKGNYWDSSYLTVFDVRNNRFSTIENVFKGYIFSSDRPEYETTKTLHEDISNRTKKYVITKKKNIKFAGTYFVHRDRSFLWTAAINEWRKNTVFGNGVRHYQNKYRGTFPHNMALEMLSDFGIAGLTIFSVMFLALLLFAIRREKKRGSGTALYTVIFALCFIPSYLTYTSLYQNGAFLFTSTVMISFYANEKIKSKDLKERKELENNEIHI